MTDPWMVERAIGDEILTAGEKRIFAAVKEAMTVWLDTARALVLRTELPAKARTILDSSLTAAGEDEYVPDPDDIQASFPVWEAMLTDEILPTVALSFGEGFLASSRAADISAIAHQERHLEEVFDRLKIWPVGAFEELRPELLESLANGESIDQTRDRIGRVLSIDAPSQRIRADISDVDRRLADPDTPRSDLVSLRAERRRLWNSHDEALQEWQWKARRIARTEVQGAVEGGSQAAAAEIAAVTGEQMYKQWLATSDERTRRSHSVADGQIVRIEDKFRVGGSSLDHPADPRGRDKEIINCRCTTRILDQSEVDDELGGKWGNLGVRPMSARMGPDPDESIDAAIGALAAEQRGEKAEWPKPVAPPAPKKAKAKNEFAGRSLDSLQNDMIRMVEDPNMDEATFTRLADEIDRREIKNAAARAQRATQRAAIRATQEDEYFRLTEGGMDDLEATSKAFAIPLDRLKRQRATEWLRAQGAQGKSLPALIKDYHLDIVLEETMRAEAATNGVMFKRQYLGKGGTYPFSAENLWRMPEDKAREHASEELLAHWDQFGRTTQEQIKANAMNDFDSLRNIRSASRDFHA